MQIDSWLCHKQLVVSIPRLSIPSCQLLGKINAMGTFFSTYKTSVISVMVGHFDCKHSCLVEKNVPIAFILPSSRWQDGAKSLGIETTSYLCF